MKVWFGCTTLSWEKYSQNYFQIRDHLVKMGCVILHDWIDYADQVASGDLSNKRNQRVYQQVTDAISAADLVVIEATVPNFSTAHQIQYALMRKKPTLVLRLHKDKNLFNDSYLDSLADSNLRIEEYAADNVAANLEKFVNLHSLENRQGRYNIVLQSKHKYYLDWLSENTDQSRSAIIRELIEGSMYANEDFAKYLQSIDLNNS